MKKRFIIVILISLLAFSCNGEKKIETNNYKFEFSKASIFHRDFINKTYTKPLQVAAKKITLKNLLNTIFKEESVFFKFENEKLAGTNLETTIVFKNENISIKKEVFQLILNELNLKSAIEKEILFELKIQDTTKLFKHYSSNASNNSSKVYRHKDSIAINNVSLKEFSKLINDRFNIYSFSNNSTAVIDYTSRSEDFVSFKKELKNNLGLELVESNSKQNTYLISVK
ncbi:hypothetical protein [Lacinutrix jangbogonensis]|uniref:hypothetical protein n=1 Tax=Lacinutrix jangbogonensis TaxID=1469557 RepID=UPI00053EFA62|nr:hypothetical protein [Lacinutrix jangbogonensis]